MTCYALAQLGGVAGLGQEEDWGGVCIQRGNIGFTFSGVWEHRAVAGLERQWDKGFEELG